MSWRIFIIICTLFFLTCQDEIQNGHNKLLPRVEKGILDLRSWDLDKDGPVPLAGDWEFYWKDFIDINLFSSSTEPKAPSFIYVPGIWNDFAVSKTISDEQSNENSIGGKGYATYRLQILMPDTIHFKSDRPGIKIWAQNSSYQLFINGILYSEVGKIAKNENESSPAFFPQIIPLINQSKIYDVVFYVSNYDQAKGGLWNKVLFGTEKDLIQIRNNNLFLDLFLFGALTLMGFYHLGLFNLRRKDQSSLYFGIYCFIVGAFVIFSNLS